MYVGVEGGVRVCGGWCVWYGCCVCDWGVDVGVMELGMGWRGGEGVE